ncbi:MAG: TRAP transporter substrate-binding protein DctP [Desulfobacteraceae bacterium]|nr:TRAP transporter substrate-binding protein DctP [Desulfobacteraceae bacterium]
MRFIKSIVLAFVVLSICLYSFDVAISKEYNIMTILPEHSSIYKELQATSKIISHKTDEKVIFNFSPARQVMKYNIMIDLVESGQIDGAMVNGANLNEIFQDCRVYTLPMIFKSKEESSYVRKNMDPGIFKKNKHEKIIALSGSGGSFSGIFSMLPIKTPDDLINLKVWAPGNTHLYAALGKTGSVINIGESELLTALKAGKVDAVITTPMNAVINKLHRQCKFYLRVPLLYSYIVVVFNKESFENISFADKKKVKSIFRDTFSNISSLVNKYNNNALEVLDLTKVSVVDLNSPDTDLWNSWASLLTKQLEKDGVVSKKILGKITMHLELRNAEYEQGE